MAYATTDDVQARMSRLMSSDEREVCANLLDDAAVIIDAYNKEAGTDVKNVVSVRMVIRALGSGDNQGAPVGAVQGSMSALGYSQSWSVGSSGSVGELYIGKLERKLLGLGDHIGSYSPTEALVPDLFFDNGGPLQ